MDDVQNLKTIDRYVQLNQQAGKEELTSNELERDLFRIEHPV